MNALIAYAKEKIRMYPDLRSEIIDLVEMAKDEIEDGGSEEHEVELAIDDIKEMIEDHFGRPEGEN